MSLVTAKNVFKSYGPLAVLNGVSFAIEKGQKVALTGLNGTGKSTLLRLIAGLEGPDKGQLARARGLHLGYLPQEVLAASDEMILNYVRGDVIEEGSEPVPEHKILTMLAGFGLGSLTLAHKVTELSSGQKSKIALIKILLHDGDLLLLDEPTNNLDLPALIWLEDFIINSPAACLVVSHDRRFLDRVASKIFEIDWDTRELAITGGSYSEYLRMTEKRRNRAKADYQEQQEEIERLTARVEQKRDAAAEGAKWQGSDNDKLLRGFKRDRAKGSTRVAKVLERRVKRMERVENPAERVPLEIKLEGTAGEGALTIECTDLVAGYHGSTSFRLAPISLDIVPGSRVAILGLNGSGKSTLLKTLTGRLAPLAGTLHLGAGVCVGNLMQEHESLPREATLLSYLKSKTAITSTDVYNLLQHFGFSALQVEMPIASLSPGGRARLLLALFAAQGVNTLILDEPTNHLDLEALEALEEMLKTYQGTVLLVSHDRSFLEHARLDHVYTLQEGRLTRIPDYQTYVRTAEAKAKKLLARL
jgi:ATPase subunit of ABC transporter with duplicated ATPase domains